MKQKINLRLSLIALIAIISTTIGITLIYYNLFQIQVRDDLCVDAKLLDETGIFQKAYEDGFNVEDFLQSSTLDDIQADNLRITWIDQDGTVLYDNDANASSLENHSDRPEIQEAIKNGQGECIRRSETLNMNTFYYALLLENGTIIRVSTQARSISSMFFTVIPVISAIVVVILLICILLGHLLTVQLLRPLNMMAEHLDDQPLREPVYKELEPFADKIRSQHDKILSAATSRQDFTANISHELKTPLTAISGYAELIENKMVDEEREVYIAAQIRKNTQRLLSLINDIIKLSELDHEEIPRNFTRFNLTEIALDCCNNLQVSAQSREITLSCTYVPVMMLGDKDLIKEMIENLVQNAIRYNREHGFVVVRVLDENGHAVLSVKDNGIGIPADLHDRIFERFYRVDKSRSRESGGTGLGLAIVKHIAEIHNAKITVDSELGKGTDIRVRF